MASNDRRPISTESFLEIEIPWNADASRLQRIQCIICGGTGEKIGRININGVELGIQKCRSDDCMWLSPRPDPAFYHALYNMHFYNSTCPEQYGYAQVIEPERRAEKARLNWNDIERACPVTLNKNTFLEVGCATGEMLGEASRRGWKHIYGNELNETAADVCRKSGYNVITGDFAEIPSSPLFDLIFADNVIEHLMDPADFIRRMSNLMCKDGVLCLRLPNTPDSGPRLKLIDHTYHFNARSLHALMRKCCMKIATMIDSGIYRGTAGKTILNMTVFCQKQPA